MWEEETTLFRRVGKIATSDYYVFHVCLPFFCSPVRPSACNNSAPNGQIFMKFDICEVFENLQRKLF
jgi:hypothetical protein